MTEEERMIEFQRNPFDMHDIHIVNGHHDHDEKHHEAVLSPIPQAVEQMGVDPSHNVHYVTLDEDHDMRYHNGIGTHHDDYHGGEGGHGIDHDGDGYYHEGGYANHQFDHPPHDLVHATTDHGNYHNENHYSHLHRDGEHGSLYDEHHHTYPASAHQSPTALAFQPPQRELPMFRVQHPHGNTRYNIQGYRRSDRTTFRPRTPAATLNNGQNIDYGNRVLASYTQQNLNSFLQQANLEYLSLNEQANSLLQNET